MLVCSALLLVATAATADQEVTRTFSQSVPRGAVERVIIDIPAGEFEVRNGAANTITASGVISRQYDGTSERRRAQKIVDATGVEIYVSGEEAIVRRSLGDGASSWRSRTFTGFEVKLIVPAGVDLEFETNAGDIDVEGRYGDIAIDLRAGEVDLRMPKATVRELNASCRVGEVRTNFGDEIVEKEGVFPGRTQYKNYSGQSRVNVHVTAGEVNVELTP